MSPINKIREGPRLGSIETIAHIRPIEATVSVTVMLSLVKLHYLEAQEYATSYKNILLIEDDPVTVGTIDTDNILGDLNVENNLVIGGELIADKIKVEEVVSTQKHVASVDFDIPGDNSLIGLQWRKKGEATKQIVWRDNRFYISSDIDLHRDASVKIDDIPVLTTDPIRCYCTKVVLRRGRLTNPKQTEI